MRSTTTAPALPTTRRSSSAGSSASALAREQSDCAIDLPYGGGPNETLDVFRTDRPDAPVFVFIHGGYWRALDKRDQSFVAPALVDAGAMVVLPNYALCPAVTIEHDHAADGAGAGLDVPPCARAWRRPAAHRRRPGIRPAATWRR